MTNQNYEVEELYTRLKIQNENKQIRNQINVGTMEKKLNTDYSVIFGNKRRINWNNSTDVSR